MPTYEYACRSCSEHLEVVQSFRDDPLTTCPGCSGELRKVFSAAGIIFKGSGWHIKDYADSGSGSSTSSSSSEDSGGAEGSGGSQSSGGSEGSSDSGSSSDTKAASGSADSSSSSSSKDSSSTSSATPASERKSA